MNASGKRGRQNPDWFTAGIANLEPAIAAKRAALLDYKREASDKTLAALRRATNDAQRDRPPPRQRLLAESLSEQPTLRLGLKTWRGEDRECQVCHSMVALQKTVTYLSLKILTQCNLGSSGSSPCQKNE